MTDNNRTSVLVKVLTRAILATIIIGTGSYAIISGVAIPPEAWEIGGVVIGAYFGIDAIATYRQHM
jgi:formate/nitrite transporter FocA (FNT family)